MKSEFTYHAFISYSHKDEKIAKKLQQYLEHYKLPSVLCRKYPHIPTCLRPIFRDRTDLAIGQIDNALTEALSISRHLIVLCSQYAAKPNEDDKNWIDEEIKIFLSLRPENVERVIPIILRKEGSITDVECLPPTIRKHDILAADLLTKGKERTLNDVVAKMIGLQPDTLWGRHLRELRKHKLLRCITGTVTILLSIAAGCWYWNYHKPQYKYYADYIKRNNIPEGRIELKEEQIRTKHRHYRFTTCKGLLRKIEFRNSAGQLQNHTVIWNQERPAAMNINYNESGTAINCELLNAQGEKYLKHVFSAGAIDFWQINKDGSEIAWHVPREINKTDSGYLKSKTSIGRYAVKQEKKNGLQGIINLELFRKHSLELPASVYLS